MAGPTSASALCSFEGFGIGPRSRNHSRKEVGEKILAGTQEGGFGITLTTASELVDWLQAQPQGRRIVLSKEAEGQDYSPLAVVWHGMYKAQTPYSGDVYPTDGEIDAEGSLFTEEDRAPSDAEPVIALTGLGIKAAAVTRDRIGPAMKAQELMTLKSAATTLRHYGITDAAGLLNEIVRNEEAKRNFSP